MSVLSLLFSGLGFLLKLLLQVVIELGSLLLMLLKALL